MEKKQLDDATKKRLRAGQMLLEGNRPAEVALARRGSPTDGVHMEGVTR
jgi:hypothetical protein